MALSAFDGLLPAIIITGASEGIGLAFARILAHAGSHVIMIARNATRLESAAVMISRDQPGARITTLALDVTEPDALARLDAKLAEVGCYADLLINNAGSGLAGSFVTHSPVQIDALLTLNVVTLTRLCRHVLSGQLLRGRGGIINVASLGGFVPGPYEAVYYASKAYVLSLSEALAVETAGLGVHVMAVAPGSVETAFHAKMGTRSALYRVALPPSTPDTIARRSLFAYRCGMRVVVPAVPDLVMALALRVVPHRLMAPLVGLLIRPR